MSNLPKLTLVFLYISITLCIVHGEDPVPERLEAINKIWNEQEEMLNASGSSKYTFLRSILLRLVQKSC